ncbi:hypothetical protein [Facilibium subflavum]|uniref:hypothetical protein n=1 Tax=Facilibium subflavum TaxID=2219058 RepID=UPI000E64C67B|nr:hypothetical protein [Facilibium subflavum]
MFKFTRTRKFLARAIGVGLIKQQHQFIKETLKNTFVKKRADEQHSFEDLPGIGVDDKKLALALRHFIRLYRFFAVISVLLCIYFFYLLFIKSDYASSIVCFAVICVTLAQTFKNHYWTIQIKQKKLGLSLNEWLYTFKKRK